MSHRENSDKDISLFRSYHGVFLIFAVVIGVVIAVLFFVRVGIPDSPKTSPESEFTTCPVRHHPFDYEQKLENRLKEHEVKLESMSDGLALWATVLTVVFIVFTILGLLEIDKKIREAKEKVFEIDSKARGIFSNIVSIMLAEETSDDFAPFMASASKYLASQEKECPDSIWCYLRAKEAESYWKENEYEGALSVYDEILSSSRIKHLPRQILAILYLRRGWCRFTYGKQKECGLRNKLFRQSREDYSFGKKFAWDDRSRAFFCVQMGEVFLEECKLNDFDTSVYKMANDCFDEACRYYPQTHNINIMKGRYYLEKWKKLHDDKALLCAKTAFLKAKIAITSLNGSGVVISSSLKKKIDDIDAYLKEIETIEKSDKQRD